MNINLFTEFKRAQDHLAKLKDQLAASRGQPRYLICLMPDSQLVYGAKPDGMERLRAAGVPLPKLPEGFKLASDETELDTIFGNAEMAAYKVRDEIVPAMDRDKLQHVIGIIKLFFWLEMRVKEQEALVKAASVLVANYTAQAIGQDSKTVH